MSSHHIVRDNQEPALLILATSTPFEIVQQLLEWSPSVMVDEPQLDNVLSWGIKIDIVLFQEHNKETIIEKMTEQFPVKMLSYQADEHPLQTALHFLKTGNYPSVNILADQDNVFNDLISFQSEMDMVVIQNQIRWSLVRSGHFEKLLADNTLLFIQEDNTIKTIAPDADNKVRIMKDHSFWIGEKL